MDGQKLELTDDVIEAINEELAYQASIAGTGRADTNDHGLPGQLVSLDCYTRKAIDDWTGMAGKEPSLHQVRKVAAIAVRALIRFGCPRREQ